MNPPPELAGWGFLAVHRKEVGVIHQVCKQQHPPGTSQSLILSCNLTEQLHVRRSSNPKSRRLDPETAPQPKTELQTLFQMQ